MKKLFSFRFEVDLLDQLRKIAYRNRRSLTAELETMIEQYITEAKKLQQ